MGAPGLFARIEASLRRDRRRRFVAAGLSLATVAGIALAVYFAAFAGGGGSPAAVVQPTPGPMACDKAPSIDTTALSPSDDWRPVATPAMTSCFSVTASGGDASGVPVDASFVIESTEPIDAPALAAKISVTPHFEFDLQPISSSLTSVRPAKVAAASRYRIQPRAPLADDTVYRVTVMDTTGERPVHEWSFQTRRTLRVVSTLPADQATDVPLNLGIELTLSHDGVVGVENNFRIQPAVEGRFETHKRTVVFVPQALQAETLYTVTLGSGVSVPNTDLKLSPFTFSFETGTSDRSGGTPTALSGLQFSRRVWESGTSEAPVLALFRFSNSGGGNAGGLNLPITVYRFAGRDAYLVSLDQFTAIPSWARISRERFAFDTSGMDVFSSFQADTAALGKFGDGYLRFPVPLPQGFYVVQTTFEDKPVQALLQVTDVATYVSVSGTRTLVWANDLATKSPLGNAAVNVVGSGVLASTDGTGAAIFDTPADLVQLKTSPFGYAAKQTVGNLIVTASNGREAVVPLADIFNGYQTFGFREFTYSGSPALYWQYMYTDRHLYHPTDTVDFWGLVRLRENPPPAHDIVVQLSSSYYNQSGQYRPQVIASTTVKTTEMGTFIGKLPFAAASPGYYQVEARIGDQVVASSYVEVRDFTKPAYKIDVLPSKHAVLVGDPLDFTVRAQFFDGSPVPNVALNYSGGAGSGTVTTDSAGEAHLPIVAAAAPQYNYGPYSTIQVSAVPALAEEGEITGDGWAQVFPSSLVVDARGEFANSSATVSGAITNVDLQALNSDTAKGLEDFHGPPAPGRNVTASVVEQGWVATENGEIYDFIAKIVRKQYTYSQTSTPIGTLSGTVDAAGHFSLSFPAQKDKSYQVVVQTVDAAGRAASQTVYIYSGYSYFGNDSSASLIPNTTGPYAPGDQVSVTMAQDAGDLPAGGDNRYLFYLGQNGIRDHAVQDSPHYSFAFKDEYIPNVVAIGVRFTGATYQEVSSGYPVQFDQKRRQLTVVVTPDKDRYKPGEKAGLNVLVTNANGDPVQAEVLLSAVDEAVFRAEGQQFFYDLGILDSLYTSVPSGVLHTYASHQYPISINQAEKGGGDGARNDFKDVALFDRVTTGSDGRGSASFNLPDNLTSWRVTALAVTPDLYAGASVALVPVSLPIFADVTMNTSYLTTDQPSIKLRAFGEGLSSSDPVSFEVSSPTLFDGSLTVSGVAFTPINLALPQLREGKHQLTIRVRSGGSEDALVRDITVVPSHLLRNEAQYYELKPGDNLSAAPSAGGVTELSISDHNRGRYLQALQSLSWTYGDRIDQMLARNLSQGLLSQYFGDSSGYPAEFRPLAYQTTDGGLANFPFADNDLVLSARAAAIAPDQFSRQALVRYFQSILDKADETREGGIIALYGMAALGEPVLLDVQNLAGRSDLSVRERLYLGLAAAAFGDQDTAGRLYSGLVVEFGQTRGPTLRLLVGQSQDDILEATSLAAILGAQLADNYAPLLFQYTTENYTKDILIDLEKISYLTKALPRLSADPVQFSYTIDGNRHDEQLDRGRSVVLRLTNDQLGHLDLRVVQGTAGVTATHLEPFAAGSATFDPKVSVSRSYQGQSGDAVTLHDGDLVRITLSYTLDPQPANGCYQITDILPSGLKPVTRLYQWNVSYDASAWSPYLVDGQRVSFCVSAGNPRTIAYYARVVGIGTFTAEPPVIQSQKAPEVVNVGQPLGVHIQ